MDVKTRQFVLMRADGASFDKIASELGTSKTTLIKWEKEHIEDIKQLQREAFAQIKQEYGHSQRSKYASLIKYLQRVDEAIDAMDMSRVSLKDLFAIRQNLITQIESMDKNVAEDERVSKAEKLNEIKVIFDNMGASPKYQTDESIIESTDTKFIPNDTEK